MDQDDLSLSLSADAAAAAPEPDEETLRAALEDAKKRAAGAKAHANNFTREQNEHFAGKGGDKRGVTFNCEFIRRTKSQSKDKLWNFYEDSIVPLKSGAFAGTSADHVSVNTFEKTPGPNTKNFWQKPVTENAEIRLFFNHAYKITWGPFAPSSSDTAAHEACVYQRGDMVQLQGVQYSRMQKMGTPEITCKLSAYAMTPVLRQNLCTFLRSVPISEKSVDFLAPDRRAEFEADLAAIVTPQEQEETRRYKEAKRGVQTGPPKKESDPLKVLHNGTRVFHIEVDNTGAALEKAGVEFILGDAESINVKAAGGAFDAQAKDGTSRVRKLGGTRSGYDANKHTPLMFAVSQCAPDAAGIPQVKKSFVNVNLYAESCPFGVSLEEWKLFGPSAYNGMVGVLTGWGVSDTRNSERVAVAEELGAPLDVEVKLADALFVWDFASVVEATGYKAESFDEIQKLGLFDRNPAALQAYKNAATGSAYEDLSRPEWQYTTFTGTRVDLQSAIDLSFVTGSIARVAAAAPDETEVEFYVRSPATAKVPELKKATSLSDYLSVESHPRWYSDLPDDKPVPVQIWMAAKDRNRCVSDFVDAAEGGKFSR